MCTLSWWVRDNGRGILFNRDERRSRGRGRPPVVRAAGAGAALMPVDPDAGGTWAGVNDGGLVVALLNYYPHYQGAIANPRSRGLLVTGCLGDCRTVADCMAWVGGLDLSVYRGFLLFALDRSQGPAARSWDGEQLLERRLGDGGDRMLTTSSIQREACERERARLFAAARDNPERLRLAHEFHDSEMPHLGPLMVREDAATDSLTEITLGEREARMRFRRAEGDPPYFGEPVDAALELLPRGSAR